MDNTDTWSLLYAAMLDGLQLDKKTFQLVYPFTSWAWPPTAPGFVSAAQYDFCSTMPQWSGVGRYASSGKRFNDAYGNFLSVLSPLTADPTLQQKITAQQGTVQLAKNDYDMVYAQASAVYLAAVNGTNEPPFTDWLATPEGSPWATSLEGRYVVYEAEVEKLGVLVALTQDRSLQEAMAAYRDPATFVRYQDPGLSGFPAVPGWSVAMTPEAWLRKVRAGEVPGADFVFSPREPPYDYHGTWAGGSAPVTASLFAVEEEGVWRSLTPGEVESIATVAVSLAAWSVLEIGTTGWYQPGFVTSHAEGPFLAGYSGYPDGMDVYLWGEGGAMDLRKTGMMVAWQPRFTITFQEGSQETLIARAQKVNGFRVGPLVMESSNARVAEAHRLELVAASLETAALEVPQIFGVRIEVLPGAEGGWRKWRREWDSNPRAA